MRFVEGLRAAGAEGLGGLLRHAVRGEVQRAFLVGDLLDVQPEQVVALARRGGTRLEVVRLLAPHELEPGAEEGAGAADVEWLDPETDERLSHGAPTWRGEKKTFATYHDNHHGDERTSIWIKSDFDTQEGLVEANPDLFFVPPYVGLSGWLRWSCVVHGELLKR